MENRVKFDISTTSIIKIVLAVLLVWFLYFIRDILVLFFIVLVIVAALGPLVNRMSRYIPRVLAVIILTIIFFGVLVAIGFVIVPPIITELKQLAINLPIIAERFGPLYNNVQNSISNYQQDLFNVSSQLTKVSSGLYNTTLGFFSGIVAVLTILVLSFYMLLEQEALKNFINLTIPWTKKEKAVELMHKIGQKMGNWLRGHILLMFVVGVLDGIALVTLGVPYALTLAVWGGITELVPYVGPWLGLIPAFVIAFTVSPLKGLIILIAFVIIQQLESQFLAPKILGKAVGLSPVIIILALLIGAKLMGILGVIIAVPVAAALSVLAQEWPEIRSLRNQ